MEPLNQQVGTPSRRPLRTVQSQQSSIERPRNGHKGRRNTKVEKKLQRRSDLGHEGAYDRTEKAILSVTKRYKKLLKEKDAHIKKLEKQLREQHVSQLFSSDGTAPSTQALENTDSSPSDTSSDELAEERTESRSEQALVDAAVLLVNETITSALSEVNIEHSQQLETLSLGSGDVASTTGPSLTPPRCHSVSTATYPPLVCTSSTMTTPPPLTRSVETFITPARNRCIEGDEIGPPELITDPSVGPQPIRLAGNCVHLNTARANCSSLDCQGLDDLRVQLEGQQNAGLKIECRALKQHEVHELQQSLEMKTKEKEKLSLHNQKLQTRLTESRDQHRRSESEKLQLERRSASLTRKTLELEAELVAVKRENEEQQVMLSKKDEKIDELKKVHVELIQTQHDLENERSVADRVRKEYEQLRCDVTSEVDAISALIKPLCERCLDISCEAKENQIASEEDNICRNLCEEFENEEVVTHEPAPLPSSSLVAQALAALTQSNTTPEDCPDGPAHPEYPSEQEAVSVGVPPCQEQKDPVVEKLQEVSEMLAEYERLQQGLKKSQKETVVSKEQLNDLLRRVESCEGASSCDAPNQGLSVVGLLREKLALEHKVLRNNCDALSHSQQLLALLSCLEEKDKESNAREP